MDQDDDDDHVQIVYEDALHRPAPVSVLVPSRRASIQQELAAQLQQQRLQAARKQQQRLALTQQATQATQQQQRQNAEDDGNGGSPQKPADDVDTLLWEDAPVSQLQPATPAPEARGPAPLTMADLKAEIASSLSRSQGSQRTPASRVKKQRQGRSSTGSRRWQVSPPTRGSSTRPRPRNLASPASQVQPECPGGTPGPVMTVSRVLQMLQGQAGQDPDAGEPLDQISSGEEEAAGARDLASDLAADIGTPDAAAQQTPRQSQQLQGPAQQQPPAQRRPGAQQPQQAQQAAAVTPGGGTSSAHRFIMSHAASMPKATPRRAQATNSQSLASRLQHIADSAGQASGTQLAEWDGKQLRIVTRRMEGPMLVARCRDAATAADAPDVFAVFNSRSDVELESGTTVVVRPPLHHVRLPGGQPVLLCANIAAAT